MFLLTKFKNLIRGFKLQKEAFRHAENQNDSKALEILNTVEEFSQLLPTSLYLKGTILFRRRDFNGSIQALTESKIYLNKNKRFKNSEKLYLNFLVDFWIIEAKNRLGDKTGKKPILEEYGVSLSEVPYRIKERFPPPVSVRDSNLH